MAARHAGLRDSCDADAAAAVSLWDALAVAHALGTPPAPRSCHPQPAQLGKSRSARRRAKRAAGAARAFNFGDVDLEEMLRAQGAGVKTKGKRGASGLLADDATKNKTRCVASPQRASERASERLARQRGVRGAGDLTRASRPLPHSVPPPLPPLPRASFRSERVTVSESARLEQVVSHGAFTADPLGAVRRHLEALLPDEPKGSKASKGGKGSANRNGSARAKEKRARARQGLPVGGDAMRG